MMDRTRKSARSDGLCYHRVADPIDCISGIICQGVRIHPITRSPIIRDKRKGPVRKPEDPVEREPGQTLTCFSLVNRARPVPKTPVEPLLPRALPARILLSGPGASTDGRAPMSLPLLEKFQASRPLKRPKSSRDIIYQGLTIPRHAPETDYKLRDPFMKSVDPRVPEQKLTPPKMVNRGWPVLKAQLEPFCIHVPPTGFPVTGVRLPPLKKFQPSRPLEPRPCRPRGRRTLITKRQHTGKDPELYITNTSGFPRLVT